jgi:hypothetical protein
LPCFQAAGAGEMVIVLDVAPSINSYPILPPMPLL